MDPVTLGLIITGVSTLWNTFWNVHKENREDKQIYNTQKETLGKTETLLAQTESDINARQAEVDFYDQYRDENGDIDFSKTLESQGYENSLAEINSRMDLYNSQQVYYQNAVDNFGLTRKNQITNLNNQSQEELNTLLANWQNANVQAGATGQVGGSASIAAQVAKNKAVRYAGADLSLMGDEGLFGQTMAELRNTLSQQQLTNEMNLDSAKKNVSDLTDSQRLTKQSYEESLINQKSDYEAKTGSLDVLKQMKTQYEGQIKDLKGDIEDYENPNVWEKIRRWL